VPDQSGDECSAGIGDDIPRISDSVGEEMRRDDFGGDRPDYEMKNDFIPLRPDIGGA